MTEPAETEYDLVHVRARPWPPDRHRGAALLDVAFEPLGWSLSLELALARRRALDRHGITVQVVPVRYRDPGVSPEAALVQAEQASGRTSPVRPRRRRAPLRLLAEHPMFYVFTPEEDPGAGTDAAAEPEVVIDRCDGHVWSAEEQAGYFTAIGPRWGRGDTV
jgi:hypothetical protein